MLLLPFSTSENCVLLDLIRTESAGWIFSSVNEFLFGDLEEKWRGAEGFIKKDNNEWTPEHDALVKKTHVILGYKERNL